MKYTSIFPVLSAVFIFAACHSSKPAATSQTATPPPAPAAASGPALPSASAANKGVIVPGESELKAIQAKYEGVTMQTLLDGHALYTGVCTDCHDAKNIYNRAEGVWPRIIDDMAIRSKLTAVQKDALTKYIFAVKATQPH